MPVVTHPATTAITRWRAEAPAERAAVVPGVDVLLTWLMQQADTRVAQFDGCAAEHVDVARATARLDDQLPAQIDVVAPPALTAPWLIRGEYGFAQVVMATAPTPDAARIVAHALIAVFDCDYDLSALPDQIGERTP